MSRLIPKRKAKNVANFMLEHQNVNTIIAIPPDNDNTDIDDVDDGIIGYPIVQGDIAGTFELEIDDEEVSGVESLNIGTDLPKWSNIISEHSINLKEEFNTKIVDDIIQQCCNLTDVQLFELFLIMK